MKFDVIVIGAGLAGLTAALELSEKGKKVLILEKEPFVGGRTASWDDDGMVVESGFHRHIGYYKMMPRVLNKVGVKVDNIVKWENNMDIRIPDRNDTGVFGLAPFYAPFQFLRGIFGNNHILSWNDKLSLVPFFLAGFRDYFFNPKKLDQYSVKSYAQKYGVTDRAHSHMLIPLSEGLFFLPSKDYSAKVFFGLFAPALPRLFRLRVGAYLGGMTELFAAPIAKKVEELGGEVRLDVKVKRLIMREKEIIGVETDGDESILAKDVVLATPIGSAKKLLAECAQYDSWFDPLMKMPMMQAITVQLDLTEPALPYDRSTFGPNTILVSFAEQSRTTFKHVPGRLSIILGHPEEFMEMDDEQIYQHVLGDAKRLGLDLIEKVKDYRVIRHKDKFYHLGPKHDWMRPTQETPIRGLTLAGDYTRQPFYSTMEGAVISGYNAALSISRKRH